MRRSYQRSLRIALCALLPFAFSAVSVAAPKITGESTKTTTKKTTKTTTTTKSSGKTTTKKRSTTTTKKRSTKKETGLKRPTKRSKRGAGSMKRKESVKRSSTVGGAKTKPAKRSDAKRPSAPRATGGKSITEKAPAKRGGFGQQKQAPRDSLRDPKGPKVRPSEQGPIKRVGPAKRGPKSDPAMKRPTKRPTAPRKEPGVKGVREVHDDHQRPHPQDDRYHEDGHYHEQQPQQEQPYYEERRPAPAPAPAYAPPPPPPCRPTGDKIMLNAGVGFEATDGIDSNNMAFVLGGGLRSGFLGVAGEAHFNQGDEGSSLSAFAGQLRLYLPVGTCANLYPLAGVSQQNLGAADQSDDSTYAFDVGAGFDLNIGGALALGVRYTRSFFSENLALTDTQNTSGHRDTFIAQLSVFF